MRLELFGTQDGILAFTLYRETGGDLWQGLCKFAVAHKFRFEDEKGLTTVSFPLRDRNRVTFHLLLSRTEERQASHSGWVGKGFLNLKSISLISSVIPRPLKKTVQFL